MVASISSSSPPANTSRLDEEKGRFTSLLDLVGGNRLGGDDLIDKLGDGGDEHCLDNKQERLEGSVHRSVALYLGRFKVDQFDSVSGSLANSQVGVDVGGARCSRPLLYPS